jgi:hypothetical protein
MLIIYIYKIYTIIVTKLKISFKFLFLKPFLKKNFNSPSLHRENPE